ncbi:hypothetical protein HG536_0E04160 [Torulaspora globosa]|uniref:Uncharacterized protein n=1 Tax=Torulaspora globosa TaxID=48254 RepID=A0A7G3ZJ19_9SACH|nr:uncharacterized protein HG536_0E04160 [Torulaspora globosa]QLL33505.1 hypothetical protein HG536_0E04160 [Torulaspora globosa]
MKVVLVDPSSADNRWRFKTCLQESSKGIRNGLKSFDLTNCPLQFHNCHVRTSLGECRLSSEEVDDSSYKKLHRTQDDEQISQYVNLNKELIFKDCFSTEFLSSKYSRRPKNCSSTNLRENLFVPSRGGLALDKSEKRTCRPSGAPKTALTVINFGCPRKVVKSKVSDLKFANTADVADRRLASEIGAICEQLLANLNTQNMSRSSADLNLSNNQNIDPVTTPSTEWRWKLQKSRAQSDNSCLTCTFRVKAQEPQVYKSRKVKMRSLSRSGP